MSSTRQRGPSKSTAKCSCCKKLVKDDDTSGIGCHSCGCWFHGQCVALTTDEVQWLGSRANFLWVCDACLSDEASKPEAKLNSIVKTVTDNVTSCITELVPKLINGCLPNILDVNVKQAVTESLPSYRDSLVNGKVSHKDNCLQFIIQGLPESESSYMKQLDTDSENIETMLNHIGVKSEGNITSIRRLGKSLLSENGERRKCRPILVSTSNPHFLEMCFARSYKLQSFQLGRVYIKKYLSPGDRQIEKQVLAKRYEMINSEGKSREDFRIKKLKLYYKGVHVPITSN